jgi:hypothetical protein
MIPSRDPAVSTTQEVSAIAENPNGRMASSDPADLRPEFVKLARYLQATFQVGRTYCIIISTRPEDLTFTVRDEGETMRAR